MTAQATADFSNIFEYIYESEIRKRKEQGLEASLESFQDDEAAQGELIGIHDANIIIEEYHGNAREDEVALEELATVAEGLESLYYSLKTNPGLEGIDSSLLAELNRSVNSGLGYNVPGVGTESIATLAIIVAALWKSIKALVDSIWARVKELLKAIDRTLPKLMGDFEYAAKMIAKIQGLPSNGRPIPLGPEGRYLLCEGRDTLNNGDELTAAMEEFTNAGKWLLTEYAAELVDVGLGIYNGLTDFDLNDPVGGLARLDAAVASRCNAPIQTAGQLVYRPVSIPHPAGVITKHFSMEFGKSPRFTLGAYRSSAFLGNYRFYVTEKATDPKEKQPASALLDSMSYQGAMVDFYPDAVFETYRGPTSYTIAAPLQLQHVLQNCDNGIRLCKYMKEFHMPKLLGRIDLAVKAIEKRSVEMNTKVEKMEMYSQDAIAHYRAALTYNTTYSQWMNRPIAGYMTHSINVCRAVLLVCNKTIASYLNK